MFTDFDNVLFARLTMFLALCVALEAVKERGVEVALLFLRQDAAESTTVVSLGMKYSTSCMISLEYLRVGTVSESAVFSSYTLSLLMVPA